MILKLFLISLLLVVNAQKRLTSVPDACSVPKSPPACLYSTATPYFKSCGIYSGGNCPRFCYALQAQYWARQSFRRRCFRFTPSFIVLNRIYAFCMYRCAYAKRRIRNYRLDWIRKIGASARRLGWKASNIKGLIYVSVNSRGCVTSRLLVYTSNPRIFCKKNKDGTYSCGKALAKELNHCTCSACSQYGAFCPSCCRSSGHIWV